MNRTRIAVKQIFRATLLVTSVCAAALAGWAQAPAQQETKSVPVSKVERKNRAPVSKEILPVKLPKPAETTLPNGLTVLILEDHRLPNVSMQLNLTGAGPLYESADLPGLANLTAQMLREGTKTRSSKQFAEDADRLGVTLFASASFGSSSTSITASGLSDNLDEWFAMLTEMLLNPSFSADELAKLKERTRANLRLQRSQPGFLATERFNRAVFGNHPAAVVSATAESLQAITPEAMSKWHHERFTPQNAILGIAGDVYAKDLIPKVKKWLENWQRTDAKEEPIAIPPPTVAKKIYLVDRPGSVQTTLRMGNIAIDRRDPDYIPMVVLNRVLGSSPASRLFLNLREEKGYTYGVYSSFTALKYAGPWQAGGDLRTEVTEGAMNEFLKELRRLREEKVPETELEEAKRSVVAGFALSLEQPAALLNYALIRKLYGFPEDYWDTYPAKISAVTAEDVQRVARKYIDPETMQVIAVGDGSKIKIVMEKFGPVEMYDTEGKPAAKAAPTSAPGR